MGWLVIVQSEFEVQATHWLLMQFGAEDPQSLSAKHWWHFPVPSSHIGVEPKQSEFYVQAKQILPTQLGLLLGQSLLTKHYSHFLVATSQIGWVDTVQWALVVQAVHVPDIQFGNPEGHSLFWLHA